MYTFYSSNILYIMFISCGEYAKAVHYALDRIRNPQCGLEHGGCLIVLVSKWCTIKIKLGEETTHTICPLLMLFRGNSDLFYLLDNQGHCDTVLSKKIFLKLSSFVD